MIESDLYEMGWDPVVRRDNLDRRGISGRMEVTRHAREALLANTLPADVADEQAKLQWADAIVVQFPLWWYGMPAILKGWFDRVFISGFAFGKEPATGKRMRFEQGPFRGTRALAVITLGDREAAIGPRGKSGELTELMFGLLHGTFAYTGMHALRPWALPSADFTGEDDLYAKARASLIAKLDSLFVESPIGYREQFTGDYTDEWELQPQVAPGEIGLSVHVDDHR